ncbi:carbonic anhydrase [Granulicella sp. dw_53]|uniref:carbonic anhydrase n=1 Tax=Granulicella sp. dw_53 TaxID=2719792 RepID=UPI001BD6BBA5|nr:carbonic anhydrase [Granulicella sp. dw_53]
MQQLLDGYQRFRADVFPKRANLFEKLAEHQKPSTLFITCADSRVVPDMILQTNPGDLFICRNAGNIVPPYGETHGGVSATIEYAVMAVNVQNIILCGHSDCGAMKAVLSEKKHDSMPTVDSWLQHSHSALQLLKSEASQHQKWTNKEMLRALTRANVVSQIQNLRTHPSVAAGLTKGTLNIYGWVYEIHSGEIQNFNSQQGRFLSIDGNTTPVPVVQPRLQLMAS